MRYFFSQSCFLLLFIHCVALGQNEPKGKMFTVSGFVKDSASGESLIGANVYIKEKMQGMATNQYGFYSITIEEGNYNLVFSFIGYREKVIPIELNKDIRLNAQLNYITYETKEVVITGERPDENIKSTDMGRNQLDVEQIKSLPAFLGEVDILKAIQLLPGVQSAGEGNSGYYVRGGGPDQNLILLDEATVYNASHLFGFFSVFNADAINNVTLIKGGMPANYGGRLASVLDISMKDGNNRKYHAQGGLGFVASRLTVEGPIKKDTASFILSGRRTFIDLFLREPFLDKDADAYGNSYFFYDLNTKLNYRLSDKDRLYLSGYFGRDKFTFKSAETGFRVDVPWGNATTSLRWNHLFSDKLFVNTSVIFSDYKFEFGAEQQDFELRLFSGIRDWNAKVDFTWFPTILHQLKFGANYTYHRFTPSNATARSGDVVFEVGKIIRQYAHDGAIYINDEFDVTDKLTLNGGLRYTYFEQVGPFERYIKNELNQFEDTIFYDKGEHVKTYQHLEPRFAMRYLINRFSSLKASFTQNYQYIHLASLSSVSLPTDVWVPSSQRVEPQFGTQYALGYFRNFKDNRYETSVEVYYKDLQNQIEYKEGALPEDDINDNADNNFTFGNGWSYGAEFFLKKALGDFSGWIGYTLAWTKRKFPELNKGEEYFAKYDRRHDVSIVLTWKVSRKWTLGATWIYATGNTVTLPSARYFINGEIVYEYGKRNDYRLDPYHRLDVSATLHVKKNKWYESNWNFSVFNVYNRLNPYFIYFADEGSTQDNSLKLQAKQVSLFPIIPSVTYNFKF